MRPGAERRSRRQQQQRDALLNLPGGGNHADVPRPDYGAQSGAHEAREGETMTTQALPPSVDQQLADARTASAQAQVRITELEKIVVKERARADAAEARVVELRAALDLLYGATLNDMTARDLPHEWSPESAMARASAALAARAGVGT
jgi:hypothetical protein